MSKSAQSAEASIMALRFRIARISRYWVIGIALIALNADSEAQTGNCVINGGINNGIQIQNCPVVQAAPTPTFHVVKEEHIKKNDDGTFTRSIWIAIDAPYGPANMLIVATGSTVTDLTVSNKTMMVGGKATDPKIHASWV